MNAANSENNFYFFYDGVIIECGAMACIFCFMSVTIVVFHVKFMTDTEMILGGSNVAKVWLVKHREFQTSCASYCSAQS
jgi:hypothetical protein